MIEVLQVAVDGTDEAWERVTGEPDVRGVDAVRIDFAGGWNVTVAVMEFVREDPLESELRRRITAALRSVGGVETAGEMDREVWFVTGTPSAMRWSGLRQKSWTTSPARHARMPEAEGGAHPLPGGRVSVPGHPGRFRRRTHEQRLVAHVRTSAGGPQPARPVPLTPE